MMMSRTALSSSTSSSSSSSTSSTSRAQGGLAPAGRRDVRLRGRRERPSAPLEGQRTIQRKRGIHTTKKLLLRLGCEERLGRGAVALPLAAVPEGEAETEATGTENGSGNGSVASSGQGIEDIVSSKVFNFGIFAFWGLFVFYATKLAPNQAVVTDKTLLEAALNGGVNADGETINRVFYSLFIVMGLWPVMYASLLLPTGKSANKVPAWPFVSLSMFLGAGALLPYFALWSPCKQEEVYKSKSRVSAFLESKVSAGLNLALLGYLSYMAFTAGGPAWASFLGLFYKSKFTHVMSLDFLVLTLMAPFWILNDAELRKWKNGDGLITFLSLLPLYGPAVYLLLRPKLPKPSE